MNAIQSGALNHGGHSSQIKPLTANQAHQHNIPAPRLSSNDGFTLGSLTPEKTQELLNKQLNKQLAEKIQGKLPDGIQLSKLDPQEFTPEKVADRIFSFIEGRVSAEQDPEKREELISKARAGVEQGFKEAGEILKSLGALEGKVKDDFDQTYSLLQERFDGLSNTAPGSNDISTVSSAAIQEASLSRAVTRNISSSIEITTQDGDTVKIDLFSNLNAQSQQTVSKDENGSSISRSTSITLNSGISYQVVGELDEDEQKAIGELLEDVEKISQKFFDGNIQKAFEKATELKIDSEELSNFSIDLQYQQTREVVVSSYQQNQSINQTPATANELSEKANLQDLSKFTKDLDKLIRNPIAENLLENPSKDVAKLLDGFNQLFQPAELTPTQKKSDTLLNSLLNKLVDQADTGDELKSKKSHEEHHSKN